MNMDNIPIIDKSDQARLVVRTQNMDEANRVSEQYIAQGYKSEIRKISQAGISIYEVWVTRKPDIMVAD